MGHIEDRWWKVVVDPVTKKRTRVKAARHGTGQRYRVRYLDPEGHERSVSFPDRQKKAAEDWLYAAERGSRPLIGVARIVSQSTPQCSSKRSR